MKIYTEIIGNINSPEWAVSADGFDTEYVELDQWTAQKSRFVAKSDRDTEYAVALKRHTQLLDGDIIEYLPESRKMVVVRINLNSVLVADLGALKSDTPENIMRVAVELGHAIGNQHWPAVVKGTKIYVPLTVDKKVMESVMFTHAIPGVTYEFHPGTEIIPYLAPDEIRNLFGGTAQESHGHVHGHDHAHTPHVHTHPDGTTHCH